MLSPNFIYIIYFEDINSKTVALRNLNISWYDNVTKCMYKQKNKKKI